MSLNQSQKTALHCAAEDGDVDTVKHLVDHGADANIKDLNGVSDWDFQIKYNDYWGNVDSHRDIMLTTELK